MLDVDGEVLTVPAALPRLPRERPASAAVIGAGFLGSRVAAELLLLGAQVTVYDKRLYEASGLDPSRSYQDRINDAVLDPLHQSHDLLETAGQLDILGRFTEGQSPVNAACSIADAVKDADVIIDATPDDIDIKTAVFCEVVKHVREDALIAISSMSIPLNKIHSHVEAAITASAQNGRRASTMVPNIFGLRFMFPVIFVPQVEITLSVSQRAGALAELVFPVLRSWNKTLFACEVEATSGEVVTGRLKFSADLALTYQHKEARLRAAQAIGAEAVEQLCAEAEDHCCVCLVAPPTIQSALCTHGIPILCQECAQTVYTTTKRCPMCRETELVMSIDS